jgi:hypothetical protein
VYPSGASAGRSVSDRARLDPIAAGGRRPHGRGDSCLSSRRTRRSGSGMGPFRATGAAASALVLPEPERITWGRARDLFVAGGMTGEEAVQRIPNALLAVKPDPETDPRAGGAESPPQSGHQPMARRSCRAVAAAGHGDTALCDQASSRFGAEAACHCFGSPVEDPVLFCLLVPAQNRIANLLSNTYTGLSSRVRSSKADPTAPRRLPRARALSSERTLQTRRVARSPHLPGDPLRPLALGLRGNTGGEPLSAVLRSRAHRDRGVPRLAATSPPGRRACGVFARQSWGRRGDTSVAQTTGGGGKPC